MVCVRASRLILIGNDVDAFSFEVLSEFRAPLPRTARIASRDAIRVLDEDVDVFLSLDDDDFVRHEHLGQTIRDATRVAHSALPDAFTLLVESELTEVFREEADDLEERVSVLVAVGVDRDFLVRALLLLLVSTQFAPRFSDRDSLQRGVKLDHGAARVATVTMEELLVWIDLEARRPLFVQRTAT